MFIFGKNVKQNTTFVLKLFSNFGWDGLVNAPLYLFLYLFISMFLFSGKLDTPLEQRLIDCEKALLNTLELGANIPTDFM